MPTIVNSATFSGDTTSVEFTYAPAAAGNLLLIVYNYDILEFSGTVADQAGWDVITGLYLYQVAASAGSQSFTPVVFSTAVHWCAIVVEISGYNPAITPVGGGTAVPYESPVGSGFGAVNSAGLVAWATDGSPIVPADNGVLILLLCHVTVQATTSPNPAVGSGNYFESCDSGFTLVEEVVDMTGSFFFDYACVLTATGGTSSSLSPNLQLNPAQFGDTPHPNFSGTALIIEPVGASNARVTQAAIEIIGLGSANARTSQLVAETVGVGFANSRISQIVAEVLVNPVIITYTLVISPMDASLLNTGQLGYTCLKVGSDGSSVVPNVEWSTTAGTIDENGILTPNPSYIGTFTVTATEID